MEAAPALPSAARPPWPVRKDALPEDCTYVDKGCPEFGCYAALACPFPECVRLVPSGRRAMARMVRLQALRHLRHKPTDELARLFGVNRRRIQIDIAYLKTREGN